jgi:hypothetical protein
MSTNSYQQILLEVQGLNTIDAALLSNCLFAAVSGKAVTHGAIIGFMQEFACHGMHQLAGWTRSDNTSLSLPSTI